MKPVTRRYSTPELTVVWEPDKCVHSGICFAGLAKVFDPRRTPWVVLENATAEQIAAQVKECPSGALSLAPPPALGGERPGEADTGEHTDEHEVEQEHDVETDENELPTRVEVTANGPLIIRGLVMVQTPDGEVTTTEKCALCRCGQSGSKPYCDGSHARAGFRG